MYNDFPLVSIVAICYNHQKFVEQCLDSIKNQEYPNIELLIIDSNSTDQSVQIISKWLLKNNSNATFIQHTKNHRLTENLNIALGLIKGKYYQGISCDDILCNDKIAVQVRELEKAGDTISLSYSGIIKIDETGNELSREIYCRKLKSNKHKQNILFGSIFYSSSALIRTDAVKEIGGYDEVLYYEDWDIALRLLRVSEFLEVPQFLSKYRVHNNSMTEVYNLQKCLSVIRIALRENDLTPHSQLINRAVSFSKKIVIAEKLFSYRLTEIIEKVWPNFTLFLVKRNYRTYFSQTSIYLKLPK